MKNSELINIYLFGLFLILLTSCSVEPKPIEYGIDHCHFCDMTVVDKTHAAELTTKKGKSSIYDAIECMVNDLIKENKESKMAYILVADYSNPGKLIDAKNAIFLISKKIKSPMGANLSAFPSHTIAKKYQNDFGGTLYNWTKLKSKFSK
jgi:copper chaperone NosL